MDSSTLSADAAMDSSTLSADDAPAPTPAPSGLAPLLTGLDEMYKVDVTFPTPRVDGHSWRPKVHGDVNSPLSLSLPDLLDSGMTETDLC